jgi:hypothetical protein
VSQENPVAAPSLVVATPYMPMGKTRLHRPVP